MNGVHFPGQRFTFIKDLFLKKWGQQQILRFLFIKLKISDMLININIKTNVKFEF